MSAQSGGIRGLDHVAVPMQNTAAMLAFYRGLGLDITETPRACSVHIGTQMINFHRPEIWQDPAFTLRAPDTKPPSGDFCVVWEGTESDLRALLARVGARIEEGPVERRGARGVMGSSIYVRDPDGNLLEFMRY
jgi:catechol 2,3-dioxygenase-like lactoylglutathione lyase family enzyme